MIKCRFAVSARYLVLLSIVALLCSCGGGSGSSNDNSNSTGKYSTLASVSAILASDECPNGGIEVHGGIDSNGNGLLDEEEISSTQYVCNGEDGADGQNGFSTLASIVNEAADANCSSGGKRINVGQDLNRNGILERSEISSYDYVCNGTNGRDGTNGTNGINGTDGMDGTDGADGTNGLDSLIKMDQVLPGVYCASGGINVTSGLDANSNGTLDASEVTYSTYVCNGAEGPIGPAGPGVTWEIKDASFTAEGNKGYIVDGTSVVTVTLPVSSTLSAGDIVSIDCVGTGGFTIAQNPNQRIITKNMYESPDFSSARWVPRDWRSVVCSADGTKIVGVGQGIYTSSDFGISWTERPFYINWRSVASSDDGTKLVACGHVQIFTSIDSGESWTPCTAPETTWQCVASSADGTNLVAGVYGGQIYTSTDSGETWAPHDSTRNWWSVASSDDGTKLVAVEYGGQIYTSTDSGVTWTPRESNQDWKCVASSADGTKLVAGVYGGQIYTSTDSGETWTQRGPYNYWQSVASSADGTRLAAVTYYGPIFTSTDSGVSWTARDSSRYWVSVACSANGSKLCMLEGTAGYLYTLDLYHLESTTIGIGGFISGGQYGYIELQYIGSDTFNVIDYLGYDFVVN